MKYKILSTPVFILLLTFSYSTLQGQVLKVTNIPATGPNEADGSLTVSVDPPSTDPEELFTFTWSAISTSPPEENVIFEEITRGTSKLDRLLPGSYGLTVTSNYNCEATDQYVVESCDDNCLFANFSYRYDYDLCTVIFTDESTGDPDHYSWSFGDGATKSSSVNGNATHTYNESDCYTVSLTVRKGSQKNTYTEEVCIVGCGDEYTPGFLDCQINGPSTAGAGHTISLNVNAVGIPPYTYEWSSGGIWADIVGSNTQQVARYLIDEDVSNDRNLSFYVDVTDAVGTTTTCYFDLNTSGVIPTVKLVVFGERVANSYLDLVPFVDWSNLVGLTDYRFTIEQLIPGNTEDFNFTSTWSAHPGMDICHMSSLTGEGYEPQAADLCLPDGQYRMCVDVQDDVGLYTDCVTVDIGTVVPPPPVPDIVLINSVTNDEAPVEIASGECKLGITYKINNDPFTPQMHDQGANCDNHYVIEWDIKHVETGASVTVPATRTDPDCGSVIPGILEVCASDFGCNYGSYEVKATIYTSSHIDRINNVQSDCCEYVFFKQNPPGSTTYESFSYTTEKPFLINYAPASPEIQNIIVAGSTCEPYLMAGIQGGCRETGPTVLPCNKIQFYEDYRWRALDINTGQAIDNFFTGPLDQSCVSIDPAHPYFDRFGEGEKATFRAELLVTDHSGFTDEMVKIVSMPLPIRMTIPNVLTICPGVEGPLFEGPIAVGGDESNYVISWGDDGTQYFVSPTNSPNPIIKIPPGISGNIPLSLKVSDQQGCGFGPTPIQINVSPIVINGLPNVGLACSSGPGLYRLGPAQPTGGSGDYSYLWMPGNHLDDPTSSNPLMEFHHENVTLFEYVLRVTDSHGCTAESDPVPVLGSAASIQAEIAEEQVQVCYGTSIEIGDNAPVNPLVGYYKWTSLDNPHFPETISPNLFLSEDLNKHPGTFTYLLQAITTLNGCVEEDKVDVTVLEDWTYRGYESKIHAVRQGDKGKLWNSNLNYLTGGYQTPFNDVHWEPLGAPQPFDVVLNQNGIPAEDGYFFPSPEYPHLNLVVEDFAGCEKEFRTNRFVLLDDSPYFHITPDPATAICVGDETCFDVEFHSNYSGEGLPPLPTSVRVSYVVLANLPLLESVASGSLRLFLDNTEGVYSGQFCLTFDEFLHNTPSVDFYNNRVHISTPFNSIWGTVSDHYDFILSRDGLGVEANKIVCGHLQGTFAGINVTVGVDANGGNCTNTLVTHPGVKFIGGERVTIEPDHRFHTQGAGEFHAYINPCLIEEMSPPPLIEGPAEEIAEEVPVEENSLPVLSDQEEIISEDLYFSDLELSPNPFTGEVNISYSLLGKENRMVSLYLLDVAGKRIDVLFENEKRLVGKYSLSFDGSGLAPGVYFYELVLENDQRIVKRAVKIGL